MFSKQLEYLKCYNYWIKICFKHTQDFIFWLVGHKFKRCPWTTHVPVNYVSCVNWQELKEVIFSLLHPIPQYKSAWTQPRARRAWIILSKWAAYGAGIERSKIELCNLRKRPGVYLTVSQLSMCLRDFLGNFVLSIILTIPASTVTLERSFSCLWRVKTYLRSTMRAERLSGLAFLHAYRDKSGPGVLRQETAQIGIWILNSCTQNFLWLYILECHVNTALSLRSS